MEKTILVGDKEIKLKSSAATNILYKRVFGEDILLKLTAHAKNIKELQVLQAKAAELKADEEKPKEEILAEMDELLSADAFVKANEFKSNTLPQLAFIMWLEANEPTEKIFSKLNQEQYLFWLMGIDQDELGAVTGEVMDLWQKGAKQHSKPKN